MAKIIFQQQKHSCIKEYISKFVQNLKLQNAYILYSGIMSMCVAQFSLFRQMVAAAGSLLSFILVFLRGKAG